MDTLHTALYDALQEAGTSEEKARAAAAGFPPPEQIATKADIARLEIKMETKFAQIDIRIAQLETKMEIKIAQLQTKMETKIAQLETKMETKIGAIKEELTVRIMWAQGVTIGVLGVLITTLKLF